MYSMVLMVAMTHGAATPLPAIDNGSTFNQARYGNHLRMEDNRFGRRRRRGGCCGGGYGGCCGGYGGWNSCGCCGGGGWSYGGSGYGCCGGGVVIGSQAGYSSGWGAGSMGGWGAGYGEPAPMPPEGGQNPYQYNYRNTPAPPPPGGPGGPGARPERIRPPAPRSQTRAESPATFIVHLPANAQLTIDGQPTFSTSDTREFITPPLPEGKSFDYMLKARFIRDGKPMTQTRRVAVRAGQNTDVNLQFPQTGLTKR